MTIFQHLVFWSTLVLILIADISLLAAVFAGVFGAAVFYAVILAASGYLMKMIIESWF
jgi:hypothetical protein